jgi:steroid delta-isomerase-like uncharacterized protein
VSEEANKAAIRRHFEDAYNNRNFSVLDELYAPDANPDAGVRGGKPGPEGAREYLSAFLTAFPDLTVSILDLIAEDDRVVCRYTGRVTHAGTFMGISPTGGTASVEGLALFRFANGRIVQSVNWYDVIGMARQLGRDHKLRKLLWMILSYGRFRVTKWVSSVKPTKIRTG